MGPSEESASKLVDLFEGIMTPLIPEDSLIARTRRQLEERHPGTPIEWAIKYAVSNTDAVMKRVGKGPLHPFMRRAVLGSQLEGSEKYLRSISEFLRLENPIDTETDDGVRLE